jgi:hypothetical protein
MSYYEDTSHDTSPKGVLRIRAATRVWWLSSRPKAEAIVAQRCSNTTSKIIPLQANVLPAYRIYPTPPDIHSNPLLQPVSWPAECLVALDIKCRPDSGFPYLSYKPGEVGHDSNNV